MPGQHNNATKEARSRAAIAVAEEMSVAYREKMRNTTVSVLFEEQDGVYYTGHTPNYIKVYAKGEDLHNQIRTVHLSGIHADGMIGNVEG